MPTNSPELNDEIFENKGEKMETNLTYEQAYAELQEIVTTIQDETVSVDQLAEKLKRASELINCWPAVKNSNQLSSMRCANSRSHLLTSGHSLWFAYNAYSITWLSISL